MWNQKIVQMNSFTKTETDSQTYKTSLWEGQEWEEE